MNQIFPGIFKEGKKIYTVNKIPGTRVYGEKLVKKDKEYREWDPRRSKLAAAVLKGMKNNPIKKDSRILYLGASTGTTVSHISDILSSGIIYAVEFAETVVHPLLELSAKRKNIVPLFADSRKPGDYSWVEECEILYVDIAQPDETEIALRNAGEFSCKYIMLAIKSQSIDVAKEPHQVYKEESNKLKNAGFSVLEIINIEPYEDKHAFILAKKQGSL